jgi:hypothetical protein
LPTDCMTTLVKLSCPTYILSTNILVEVFQSNSLIGIQTLVLLWDRKIVVS